MTIRRSGLISIVLLCSLASCGQPARTAKTSGAPGAEADSNPAPAARPVVPAPAKASSKDESPKPYILFDAPSFKLTDQKGVPYGSDDLRGQVWVANFIFTHCTATCPLQTAKIEEIQQLARRWPDWERIRLVSFTVDPERDSVERLHEYAETHHADHDHWKFLRGTRNELFAVSQQGFKLPVAAAAREATTPITHSSKFILVDQRARIRGFYDSQTDADIFKLLGDLRSVLAESMPGVTAHLGDPQHVFFPVGFEQRRAEQLAKASSIEAPHDFQFADRVIESGIRFISRAVADSGRDFKFNHYDHANGLAVADVDGDGLLDLYFVSQVGGNELWRNKGQGQFEDITATAGVSLADRLGVTASFADTDGDGDPDLFVTTTRHGNVLFENLGGGKFRDITKSAGLDYSGHSSSAEFFDYDRDGRLDLFLTNVGKFTTDEIGYSGDPARKEYPYFIGRAQSFAGHLFPDQAEPSILYRNEGENRFRNVSAEVELNHDGWSGDASPLDVNGDGWTDLYVANMQGTDVYYENVEGRKFVNRTAEVFPHAVWGGMGLKSFDYNNDGRMDLFVTNMHADMWDTTMGGRREKQKVTADKVPPKSFLNSRSRLADVFGNAFYEGRGKDGFHEVSDQINAENYWPWGLSAGDLNADGYQDAFITSSMNLTYPYHVNSLLLNDRGRTFRDAEFIVGVEPRRNGKTAAPWYELDCSGKDASHPQAKGRSGKLVVWGALGSRSSVICDLDQDGDLDIVTNDFNSPPQVLISNLAERLPNLSYLKIRLQGTRSNRDGLGARVQVKCGDQAFTQIHDGQSGYLSQSSMPLYFGLGAAASVDEVSVQWPGGELQVVPGPIPKNQQLDVVEPK